MGLSNLLFVSNRALLCQYYLQTLTVWDIVESTKFCFPQTWDSTTRKKVLLQNH